MCKVGDIFLAELFAGGNVQSGIRPVIVVSNDKANTFSPVITVIPVTGNIEKKPLPTHVYMRNCGLAKPCIALGEQVTSINKDQLVKRLGSIKQTVYEKQIRNALRVQFGM